MANDLALALGRDARTRDLPIGVYPRLGVVRLSGAVPNVQEKTAAEEITRAFPGIKSVINDLVGEAEDIVPGKYIRHTR